MHDLATQEVVTLLPGYPQFTSIWCDGKFIYTSSTANAGRLTIQLLDVDALRTSSFSYDATASYTRGIGEYVYGAGKTLFTTDSAAGRIWKIDLNTRERTLLADFGGPSFSPSSFCRVSCPPLLSAGPFWTDGLILYIVRPQQSGGGAFTRVRIDSGESTVLATGYSGAIHALGTALYLSDVQGNVQRFDLETAQFTRFLSSDTLSSFGPSILSIWADDGQSLYFTISSPEGAIGKVDPGTKKISIVAGDVLRDIDGIGNEGRFAIYLLPAGIALHGDSQFLYIRESRSLRRFDRYTGALSTVVSNLSYQSSGPGVWTDGAYAYVTDGYALRRIDLATKEIRTIAGSLTEQGFTDGIGPNGRFDNLGAIWGDGPNLYVIDTNAIRKVEIATGTVTTLVRPRPAILRGIWGMGRSLYVCDTRMVRQLNLDTLEFETIAGNDGPEGSADGIGTAAQFTRADGIWGDGTSLFVTDAMRKIRRINLETRNVTTIYNSTEPISEGLFGDGSHLYLMEGFSLRRYDPESATLTFATPGQGLSVIDLNPASSLTLVHSDIRFAAGSELSGSTAIWGYRNREGVLVSEAAVSAQPPIRNGRIYAETNNAIKTGLAISNPNDVDVSVNFYFTDANGLRGPTGTFVLHAHEELARYLDESPFSGGNSIDGTFTFTASSPVVAVAIRGLTNERSEFLITILPLVDLDLAVTHDARTMAHFASGGGWETQVLLINPTDEAISGTVQFIRSNGSPDSSLPYMIPPRSSNHFVRNNAAASISTGSVLISPAAGSPSPTPLVIFGFAPAGITLTQSGVAATQGTDFASYVESSGRSTTDATDSGIAIANTTDQTITVFLRLATGAGQPFGQNASLTLAPRAQVSKFISEIFPNLQLPFIGVVHISSSTPISMT